MKGKYNAAATAQLFAAIMADSESYNLQAVTSAIKAGANINAKDRNGRTPLHFAARYNQLSACYLLISKRADVFARDAYGQTPVECADLKTHLGRHTHKSLKLAIAQKIQNEIERARIAHRGVPATQTAQAA